MKVGHYYSSDAEHIVLLEDGDDPEEFRDEGMELVIYDTSTLTSWPAALPTSRALVAES